MRQTIFFVAVQLCFFKLQQIIFKFVAQNFYTFCIFIHVEPANFASLSKTNDTWNIERAAAHAFFMTAAMHLRNNSYTWIFSSHVQRTNSFWSVNFVC